MANMNKFVIIPVILILVNLILVNLMQSHPLCASLNVVIESIVSVQPIIRNVVTMIFFIIPKFKCWVRFIDGLSQMRKIDSEIIGGQRRPCLIRVFIGIVHQVINNSISVTIKLFFVIMFFT